MLSIKASVEHLREEPAVRVGRPLHRSILRVQSWEKRATARRVEKERSFAGRVGTVNTGEWRTLCIGPADWLVVSSVLSVAHLRQSIAMTCGQPEFVIVDVADSFKVITVHGRAARDVLSKGCGLDFHPRAFQSQQCARTRFAGMPAVIEALADGFQFEVYVARSYAAYLEHWLTDAAAEFVITMSKKEGGV